VILVKLPRVDRNHHHPHLLTFDLGRRGWSILPHWDGDGTERRVAFENKREFRFQGAAVGLAIDSLGDDKFVYLVSRSVVGEALVNSCQRKTKSPGSGGAVHVWELV